MRGVKIGAAVVTALGLWSAAAAAEDAPAAKAAKKGEITIVVKITGRRQVPSAAIDVARLMPRAPLPELRKPLIDHLGKAVERAPF